MSILRSGSRAELESFTDISATIMESRNHVLAAALQEQIINHLTTINFGIERLVDIQVGNVKQSQLFFERHPTLDPNQTQQQHEEELDERYDDDDEYADYEGQDYQEAE